MAVYKHNYSRYTGPLTARWQRVLVLPRYAYRSVFQSRFFLILLVVSLAVPLAGIGLIYLRHNLEALGTLKIPIQALVPINAGFFRNLMIIQGWWAFLLTVFVGPGLVSPDLTNNALPLYLSRAFSKTEYVLGKMMVLLILQSCVTWVPLFVLFFVQGSMAGGSWMVENLQILFACFAGAWIWMLVLSLLALAISAWVRWKAIAGALLFGVFFVSAGFGSAVREILSSRWGDLFHLNRLIRTIWNWLFMSDESQTSLSLSGVEVEALPVWSAFLVLAVVCGFCLLLLNKRIRACEVVR